MINIQTNDNINASVVLFLPHPINILLRFDEYVSSIQALTQLCPPSLI